MNPEKDHSEFDGNQMNENQEWLELSREQVALTYERAANLIERHGHWRGPTDGREGAGGRHCVLTALGQAKMGLLRETEMIITWVPRYLIDHLGLRGWTELVNLNDSSDQEWAVGVLREVAEKLRAG